MKRSAHFLRLLICLFVISCTNKSDKINNNIPEKKSPNFIFILTDDQEWNGTSVQMMNYEPRSKSDYYETPNLEYLANKGITWKNKPIKKINSTY